MSATVQSGALGSRRDEYDYSFEGWLLHEDRDVYGPDAESTTFSYDPAGNRLTRARSTATTSDLTTYTYAVGNRLTHVQRGSDPAAALDWNGLGEVKQLADGTDIERYPSGAELAVLGATATADIVRDAFGRPVVIDDGDVAPTVQVWGNPGADLPLAGIDADGVPFANLAVEGILVGELHGSTFTVAATDGHGDLLLTGNAELLGRPGAFGDAADLPASSANRYRWGGQAQLAGTKLSLAQHRLYDADAGLWLSADPIGLRGGPHRFGFVGNSPLMGVDPSGYSGVASYGAGSLAHEVTYSAESLAGMSNSTMEAVGNADVDAARVAFEKGEAKKAAAAEAAAAAAEVDAAAGDGGGPAAPETVDPPDAATDPGTVGQVLQAMGGPVLVAYVGSTCFPDPPVEEEGTTTPAADPNTYTGDESGRKQSRAERRAERKAAREARQEARAAARAARLDAQEGPTVDTIQTDAPDLSHNVFWRDSRGRNMPFPREVSFGRVGVTLDRNANKKTGPYTDGPYGSKGGSQPAQQVEVGRGTYTRTGADHAAEVLLGELIQDDASGHESGPAGHVVVSVKQRALDEAATGGKFAGMSHRHPDNITTDPMTGAATGGSPDAADWVNLGAWGGDSLNALALFPDEGEPLWPGPRNDLVWITRAPDHGLQVTEFPALTTSMLTAPQLAFVVNVIFGSDGVVYSGTSFQVMEAVTPDPAGINAVDLMRLEVWDARH